MNRSTWALLSALLLGAITLAWMLTHRDEARIRKAFSEVMALCEKAPGEGLLVTAMRAQDVTEHFTSNAVVRIGPPYPVSVPRNELASFLARARHYAEALAITTRGDEIDVAPGRRTAEMRVTVEVHVTVEGQEDTDIGEYRIAWERVAGRWLIASVEHLNTIQRPASLGDLP